MKPIKLQIKLKGGEGSVIPKGVIETLKIEIVDQVATFRFMDWRTTKLFAVRQHNDGVFSKYIERLQKTCCSYPNMKAEDILKHIQERLKALEGKK